MRTAALSSLSRPEEAGMTRAQLRRIDDHLLDRPRRGADSQFMPSGTFNIRGRQKSMIYPALLD